MRRGVLSLLLCAGLVAIAAAAVPSPAAAKRTSVTAAIPRVATTGDRLRVRGRARGATGVLLQQRVGKRWARRARGRAGGRRGRYAISWAAPARRSVVTLRVAALRHGRVVAVSRARRVAISPVEVLAPAKVIGAPAPGRPGEVRYAGRPEVDPGEYLASDVGPATPEGMLVRVVAERTEGAQTVLDTVPASLIDAIPEGNIALTPSSAARHGGVKAAASPEDFRSAFECTGGVSAELEGALAVRLDPTFKLGWSWGRVKSAEATATLRGDASLAARISGRGSCELSKTSVGSWDAPPLRFTVGPVPVVITPRTTLYVSGKASARAAFETGVSGYMSATAGLRYDGSVQPIGHFDQGFSQTPPATRADAAIGGRVIPSVAFLLYGQVGPRFDLETGLQLDAVAGGDPWWKLTLPVDLSAGLFVPNFPRLSIDQRSVFSTSVLLAQAESDPESAPTFATQYPVERASVSWDTDGTDVDLHVWDSDGNHAWYRDQEGIPEALLSSDDTDGYGPEFFDETPADGPTFTFGLCYYSDHDYGPTDVTVRIADPDGTVRQSVHTLSYTGDSVLLGSSPEGAGYTPPDGWCAPAL